MSKYLIKLAILFFTVIIGSCFYFCTKNEVIQEVDGFNKIEFAFTYIEKEADLTVSAYNEQGQKVVDTQKYYNIESHASDQDKGDIFFVEKSEIFIPVLESHKIEFTFSGKENLVLLQSIAINNRDINIHDFVNKVESSNHFKIGTVNGVEGIFIQLLDDNVTFDITNALQPIKLTEAENEQFKSDYEFLCYVYLGLCLILCGIVLLLIKKFLIHDNSVYLYFFGFLSACITLNTAFFLSVKDILYMMPTNSVSSSEEVTLGYLIAKFEQNYLPIFALLGLIFLGATYIKNKIFKTLLFLMPLVIWTIFTVDSCINSVLGTRLNFYVGGDFAGEYKYFGDFIIKFVLSQGGALIIVSSLLLIFTICLGIFCFNIKSKKSFSISYVIFAIICGLLGLIPTQTVNGDYKLLNVFQANNISFYNNGNFFIDYSDDYEPRLNLDLNWKEAKGLNQAQNVILVLVESWGCNHTYICGDGPSYMPELEQIAKENLLFDNYYSIVPATSLSYLAIAKSVPVVQGRKQELNQYTTELYKENDLVTHFNNNGYITRFISSTDHVFGMDSSLKKGGKFTEVIDAKHDLFKSIKERYVFNSVSDGDMFDGILKLIKNEKQKFFYVTKTASNHSPYNSPLAANNDVKAFEYTDKVTAEFIDKLKQSNYFDNGILVLVGDHHMWDTNSIVDNNEPTKVNKVPLIIIGKNQKQEVNHAVFSHASLGVLLQYFELPTYKYNKFNTNPLDLENKDISKDELVVGYDYQKLNVISYKYKGTEGDIIISGNKSEFVDKDNLSEKDQQDILGFIATFRD